MLNMKDTQILISGGGLGGLSAALALAERGFEVTVLEKAAEFTEIGYGIQLGPNATRILKRYGLWDTISSSPCFLRRWYFSMPSIPKSGLGSI